MTDESSRDALLIRHAPFQATLPFDAKDADTAFPAIEPLRPRRAP